ncbi:hypothetical protein, partial [Escherichia coli]|uniref:hypothetical protein n=1 Tax=Escherichia coli TaxID=562 RepID=UPI0020109F95
DRIRIAATGRIVFRSSATYHDVNGYISWEGTGNTEGSGYFYGSEFHVPGSIWTPILYDRNNSAYRLDPDGTNRLNFVNANNIYINAGYMLYSDSG